MKKLLLIILVIHQLDSMAQITGIIYDSNNKALPFANVLLLNASDSSFSQGSLTGMDGSFQINNVANGSYLLSISFVSYDKWHSEIFAITDDSPGKLFNNIILDENTQVLDGVEVTAQKIVLEQTMEGTTMNVQSSMMSKGNSALQILERSPGVILDQRNNALTLNGQSGTLIMINGKPVRMPQSDIIHLLSGMSADNLDKIELLTNPSAKYDADGGAGIINLIIKKNENQGTNGSLSGSLGYGWAPKETLSGNINRQNGSTNLFSSYAFNHDKTRYNWHAEGSGANPQTGYSNTIFSSEGISNRMSHNLTLGVEHELGNSTIGTSMMYSKSSNQINTKNDGKYDFERDDYLQALIDINQHTLIDNLNVNAFTDRKFEKGKLFISGDYLQYNNETPSLINNTYLNRLGEPAEPANPIFREANWGQSNTKLHVGILQMDFEKNFDKVKWEAGIKSSYSTTMNHASTASFNGEVWQTEDNFGNNMQISESIAAGYSTLHFDIDSLTNLTAGVRYENWTRNFGMPELDGNFHNLFPSLFAGRKIGANTQLQLAYNRRITRPQYNDLASFFVYNDATSVFSGNPLLKPTITDNFRLGLQWNGYNIALTYSNEANPIVYHQITENDEIGLSVVSPQNLGYQKSIGLQTNIPLEITPWWSINLLGSVGPRWFHLIHTPEQVAHQYIGYNFNGSSVIQLPLDISLEVSGFYNSDNYYGSMDAEGFGMMNAGLKRDLGNNRGSLQFTVTDVLKTMQYENQYGALTPEAYNSQFHVIFQPESRNNRIFRLTYSKRFGNSKLRNARGNGNSSGEAKSRIRQN
ncbi:MAG: TonB-dependent receptor [Cyclobacteriaceae bacterium]